MKSEVMTFKVEKELKEAFKAVAQRNDRPAAQVIREFMREYISMNRKHNALTLETMLKYTTKKNGNIFRYCRFL